MAEVHETVPPCGDDFSYVTRGAIGAITSAQQKLRLNSNGLLIYTETVVTAAGEKKEVSIDLGDSLCLLDNKFHVDNYVRENDKNIAIWKIKRLIKALKDGKGKERSLISLVLAPWDEISEIIEMLDDTGRKDKYMYAKGAITSAKRILKEYSKVPANGLVIYSGTIDTNDGRGKDVTVKFEPLKLIYQSIRLIINEFDIKELTRLLEPEPEYGFIVMVDDRALFGMLSGNRKKVLHEFTVHPPIKQIGEADHEYQWRRREFRNEYLERMVKLATRFYFIDYIGLVVAVSPTYQTNLLHLLHPHFNEKIMCELEVSYGGKPGFNEAIALSYNHLYNVRFNEEIRLLKKFMEEIGQSNNKYVFGVEDTLKCLDRHAVKILIVWENLDINRYMLKNTTTGKLITKHLNKEQEANQSNFRDSVTNAELEVQGKTSLIDWFAQEYKKFGCTLEFVTDSSPEGSQFCRAFGGIGGILKDQVHIQSNDNLSDAGDQSDVQSSDDHSDDEEY